MIEPHSYTVAEPAATWRYVLLIARARMRITWRRLRRRRFGPVGLVLSIGLMILLAAGAALAGLSLGSALASKIPELASTLGRLGLAADDLPLILPAAVFLIGWLALFFLTFASLLGTLYLQHDLPALLVAPVPITAVFLSRFLEALALPLVWTLALGVPALWGYGLAIGFGPLYFPAALLLLLCLPLVPLGLAAGLTLWLLRYIPAPRAAEILTVIGALFGVAIWIGSQSVGQILNAVGVSGGDLARGGLALANPLLPWAWAAHALVSLGTGELLSGTVYALLFAGLSLITLGMSVHVAERVYYLGWASANQVRQRRRPRPGAAPATDPLARLVPGPVAAIARKDWRLMRRDPRGYSSLIWILAMLVFWTWRARQEGWPGAGPRDLAMSPAGTMFAPLVGLAPVAFALLVSGLRWGMESVSRDQRAFQLLQVAPVPMRHVILGKWLGAYLPGLALATLVLSVASVISGQLAPFTVARNFLIAAPILAGQTAILVAFGAARPNFEWSDPKEMSGGLAGCFGALVTWAFVALALLLIVAGWLLPPLLGLPQAVGLVTWLAVVALSAGVGGAALAFAAERLSGIEL